MSKVGWAAGSIGTTTPAFQGRAGGYALCKRPTIAVFTCKHICRCLQSVHLISPAYFIIRASHLEGMQ